MGTDGGGIFHAGAMVYTITPATWSSADFRS
jgi:hypothetical protein